MIEFLIILTATASLTGMALTWYLVVKNSESERREFTKAHETEIVGQREQLEKDLYIINKKLVRSPYGYDIFKNIYNEDLSDICLSWKVKDDSFFKNQGFELDRMSVDDNMVTCLMPFHADFDKIYNRVGRSAKKAGFVCRRSDEIFKPGDIMKYTVELILKAQIVIGVLDGRNPNVFYEVGIAHSVGKPVILIAEEQEKVKIPFDLQQHRFIFYKSLNDLEEKLTSALNYARDHG